MSRASFHRLFFFFFWGGSGKVTVEILRVTRRLFHQALHRFSADKTNIPRAKSRQLRENLGDSLGEANRARIVYQPYLSVGHQAARLITTRFDSICCFVLSLSIRSGNTCRTCQIFSGTFDFPFPRFRFVVAYSC